MTHKKETNGNGRGEVVFTMGLPGAGKSTALHSLGLSETHGTIDPDAIKAGHPDYDPKNPAALHAWSQDQTEIIWKQALADGGDYIMDGTGTNAEKMVRRMNEATAMGFSTRLLYVHVSLQTALERNARRARTVPEHVVKQKALDIATAFEIVSARADVVTTFDNEASR